MQTRVTDHQGLGLADGTKVPGKAATAESAEVAAVEARIRGITASKGKGRAEVDYPQQYAVSKVRPGLSLDLVNAWANAQGKDHKALAAAIDCILHTLVGAAVALHNVAACCCVSITVVNAMHISNEGHVRAVSILH